MPQNAASSRVDLDAIVGSVAEQQVTLLLFVALIDAVIPPPRPTPHTATAARLFPCPLAWGGAPERRRAQDGEVRLCAHLMINQPRMSVSDAGRRSEAHAAMTDAGSYVPKPRGSHACGQRPVSKRPCARPATRPAWALGLPEPGPWTGAPSATLPPPGRSPWAPCPSSASGGEAKWVGRAGRERQSGRGGKPSRSGASPPPGLMCQQSGGAVSATSAHGPVRRTGRQYWRHACCQRRWPCPPAGFQTRRGTARRGARCRTAATQTTLCPGRTTRTHKQARTWTVWAAHLDECARAMRLPFPPSYRLPALDPTARPRPRPRRQSSPGW